MSILDDVRERQVLGAHLRAEPWLVQVVQELIFECLVDRVIHEDVCARCSFLHGCESPGGVRVGYKRIRGLELMLVHFDAVALLLTGDMARAGVSHE